MTDIDSIASDFEFLDDWDQRYQYLIELGESLDPMPESEMTEDKRVKACMSKVWVNAYKKPGDENSIFFHGDCDTSVIKGVVALLVNLFSGKSKEAILQMDVDRLFEDIKLAENLSPNRHVGIYAITEMMKKQVSEMA